MTISDNIDTRSSLLFEASPTHPYRAAAKASSGVAHDTSSPIELAVYSDFDDVSDVWRTFEETADCTAFQTFVWHATWQQYVGAISDILPAIIVGREEGRVLFIAPFAIERGRVTRRLVWHAWQLCDYNAPLLAPGFAERVSDHRFAVLWQDMLGLLKSDPRFAHDVVMLHKMPGEVAGLKNPFASLPVTAHASSAYAMALGHDWETFYKEKRSSSTRRHARAKLKNLGEIGPVEFATAGAADDVTAVLATLFDQKSASFARMGVANFLLRPGYQDFYRAIAAAPENRSLVHVSQLQVGGATSAANLGMVFRGRYYHVLASHGGGPAIERFGPGTAHLHMLVAYAIERGCHTFDFTIGDESYKREWCEQHTALWDLCHASSARGTLVFTALFAAMSGKRFIKHSAPLWSFYKRARRVLASFRGAGRSVQSEASSDGS